MKIKLLLFLLLVSLVLSSCHTEDAAEKKGKSDQEIDVKDSTLPSNEVSISEKQFQAVGIELGEIQKKPLPSLVKANGFIVLPPQKKANVSTLIGGMVKSINVIPGNFVKKGQTLALLESTDYIQMQEDYEKAKSNLDFLEKEYERQKEMLSANGLRKKWPRRHSIIMMSPKPQCSRFRRNWNF
ncbi:MAG: efflux RND transporter periplasmic adaptor subunit [Ginsengibacter sp.]